MIPRFTGHAEEFYEDRGARTSILAGGNLRETGYVETGEGRNSSRSHCARDGHRFESPQLHQEVGASGYGFPDSKIPRRRRALAGHRPVCGSNLRGFLASYRTVPLRVSMPRNSVSQRPVGLAEVGAVGRAGDRVDRGFRRAKCGRHLTRFYLDQGKADAFGRSSLG